MCYDKFSPHVLLSMLYYTCVITTRKYVYQSKEGIEFSNVYCTRYFMVITEDVAVQSLWNDDQPYVSNIQEGGSKHHQFIAN